MARRSRRLITSSSEETLQAGREFAATLQGDETIAFFGELGSGKTTFLKGLISSLAGCSPDSVTSPTFTYLHIYGDIYHFDLYRLSSADEFRKAGFSEYLEQGICCIEWAERIADALPIKTIRVTLKYKSQNQREIVIL